MIRAKEGLNMKSHLAADAHGMPVRALVTRGATADCARAIAQAEKQGMEAVIPPKKSRRERRDCDREPCRARHPIGNAFPHLK